METKVPVEASTSDAAKTPAVESKTSDAVKSASPSKFVSLLASARKTIHNGLDKVSSGLDKVSNSVVGAVSSSPEKPQKKLPDIKIDEKKEPLLAEDQAVRLRLVANPSLQFSYFAGYENAEEEVPPQFKDTREAYLIARYPNIWCKINPYYDCEVPADEDQKKMRWLVSRSPLFYIKSKYPEDHEAAFDRRVLEAFANGEIDQFFQEARLRFCADNSSHREANLAFIQKEKVSFINECNAFLPRILVGDAFCHWIAVQPVKDVQSFHTIIAANSEAINRYVLWRLGRQFDGVVKYLETLVRPQGDKAVQKIVRICVNYLFTILQRGPEESDGFTISEADQADIFDRASATNAIGYYLLLNIMTHLKNDDFLRRIAEKIDVEIFGDDKPHLGNIAATVQKETKCIVNLDLFSQHIVALKREMVPVDDLMTSQPLPAQRGLQMLFNSGHLQVLELGRQLLWNCNPVQLSNLARKHPGSGHIFSSDVKRFCVPLLDQLLGIEERERVQEWVGIAENIVANEKVFSSLDATHLVVLVQMESAIVDRAIAHSFEKSKKIENQFQVMAHQRVSVDDVRRLLSCFSTEQMMLFRDYIQRNQISSKALAKIILCQRDELRVSVAENLQTVYNGNYLLELFTFQNPAIVLINEISSTLVRYVSVSNHLFHAEFFRRNIEYFLMCVELYGNQDFMNRCCESRLTTIRVLDVLSNKNDLNEPLNAFLCAFVTNLVDGRDAQFLMGEAHEYLLKLFDRNDAIDRLLLQNANLVVALYEATKSLTPKQWEIVFQELAAGRLQSLLLVRGGLGVHLWRQLCEPVSRVTVAKVVVWLQANLQQDELLILYLLHLTRAQLTLLFNAADRSLTARLFDLCEWNLSRILYTVLNDCFGEINNPYFYERLVRSSHLVEYALSVASFGQFEQFCSTHMGNSYVRVLLDKNIKPMPSPDDPSGVHKNKAHLLRLLRNIVPDQEISETLNRQVVQEYFNHGDVDINLLIFANPVLTRKLSLLQNEGKIRIDIKRDILPLLEWIISQHDQDRVRHLFAYECLLQSFVGAVEHLFCLATQSSRMLLDRLFISDFWRAFFADITVEQIGKLTELGYYHREKLLKGEFAREFPERVNSYYAFNEVHVDDFYDRWVETRDQEDPSHFVQSFQYHSAHADKSQRLQRWQRLLSFDWLGASEEAAFIDKIILCSRQIGLELFLKDIRHEELVELFHRKPYLGERLLLNPAMLRYCGLQLADFRKLPLDLLPNIISNPLLHRISGFTPEHFYKLIMEEGFEVGRMARREDVLLQYLFARETLMGPDFGSFLAHVWASAPACVVNEIKRRGYVFPLIRADFSTDWPPLGVSYQFVFGSQELADACIREDVRLRELCRQAVDQPTWSAYVAELHATNLRMFGYRGSKSLYLRWLEETLRLSLTHNLPNLPEYLICYLNLPNFKPTTVEMPAELLVRSDGIFRVVREKIQTDITRMVEYLIDICRHPCSHEGSAWGLKIKRYDHPSLQEYQGGKFWGPLLERERELVVLGIHWFYLFLQKGQDVGREQEQRFVALLCAATKLLDVQVLLQLFNADIDRRNNICRLLLETNLLTFPPRQAASVVRVQLILLRSFAAIPDRVDYVSSILSQLHHASEEIIGLVHHVGDIVESGYHLDLRQLEFLREHKGLVALLRYATLTSHLKDADLCSLMTTPAVARCCLLYDHLFSKLSPRSITYCLEQIGYGNDYSDIADKLQADMGLLVAHRPRLQQWIEEVQSRQQGRNPWVEQGQSMSYK